MMTDYHYSILFIDYQLYLRKMTNEFQLCFNLLTYLHILSNAKLSYNQYLNIIIIKQSNQNAYRKIENHVKLIQQSNHKPTRTNKAYQN